MIQLHQWPFLIRHLLQDYYLNGTFISDRLRLLGKTDGGKKRDYGCALHSGLPGPLKEKAEEATMSSETMDLLTSDLDQSLNYVFRNGMRLHPYFFNCTGVDGYELGSPRPYIGSYFLTVGILLLVG